MPRPPHIPPHGRYPVSSGFDKALDVGHARVTSCHSQLSRARGERVGSFPVAQSPPSCVCHGRGHQPGQDSLTDHTVHVGCSRDMCHGIGFRSRHRLRRPNHGSADRGAEIATGDIAASCGAPESRLRATHSLGYPHLNVPGRSINLHICISSVPSSSLEPQLGSNRQAYPVFDSLVVPARCFQFFKVTTLVLYLENSDSARSDRHVPVRTHASKAGSREFVSWPWTLLHASHRVRPRLRNSLAFPSCSEPMTRLDIVIGPGHPRHGSLQLMPPKPPFSPLLV